MKNKRLCLLIVPILILMGCQSKNSSSGTDYESIFDSVQSSENDSSNDNSSNDEQESMSSSDTTSSINSNSSTSSDATSSLNSNSSTSSNATSSLNSNSSTSSDTTSSLHSDSSTSTNNESSSTLPDISDNDIHFYGVDTASSPKGAYFDIFKGVKALTKDNIDLTSKIYVNGFVDYSKVGNYELSYCINTQNGVVKIKRDVIIQDSPINRGNNQKNFNLNINGSSASIRNGQGNEMEFFPPSDLYLAADLLDKPIPTSSWWTTLLTANYGGVGNSIFTNPLRTSFDNQGVEITLADQGFTQYWTDQDNALSVAQFLLPNKDLVLKSSTLSQEYVTKVINYDDNSVKVAMRNNNSEIDEMVISLVQGSPYLFAETYSKTGTIKLVINGTTQPYEFFDLNGNKVEGTYNGEALIVKIPQVHVGYTCDVPTTPNSTLIKEPIYKDKMYLINVPQNSSFTISRNSHSNEAFFDNISYTLGDGNFLSVAPINNMSEASFYHQHGYSFIHQSHATYDVNHDTSEITTYYDVNYNNVLNNDTKPLIALMPHHYKYSLNALTKYSFLTLKGMLKVFEGSSFTTTQSFYGMLPTFTKPNNNEFSLTASERYLSLLDDHTNKTFGDDDEERIAPYWDAKTFYPLAQGVIQANQLGNSTYQEKYLKKIEKLLIDWYTYDGVQDKKYLYYNQKYGTLYYSSNAFATASEMSDHHFTHGYLVYASAIAAMFDETFYNNYKDIIRALTNDYMNSKRDSNEFPYLRTFDTWAGHSWAHGFGSFAEGNNQESSGEALSSWVAGYLFGLQENNKDMIDAAIYGFTTELNSLKQYVFDYDQDIFAPEYSSVVNISSMQWGGKNTYATWFGLNPNFIYGIHYLPLGQYVSSYAIGEKEHTTLQRIYDGYLQRKVGYKDTWFANMWSVESLINADSALNKFDENKILQDDYPNDLLGAYWNINASKSLGTRTDKVRIAGNYLVAGDVYLKNGTYTAELWNSSSSDQEVLFINENNEIINRVTIQKKSFITYSF